MVFCKPAGAASHMIVAAQTLAAASQLVRSCKSPAYTRSSCCNRREAVSNTLASAEMTVCRDGAGVVRRACGHRGHGRLGEAVCT
eukprot:7390214-Prymnesium_polylepis.2